VRKSELIKRGAYVEAGVSAADIEILAGLSGKAKLQEILRDVPKGTPKRNAQRVIEEKMGKDYRRLKAAEKKLKYLIFRNEEIEGLAELKEGRFEEFRGMAYPVVTRIIAVPNVGFQLGDKEEFNDLDNALFLTHRQGFCDVDSDYREDLINELKKAIEEGVPGRHITIKEEDLSVTFRLTVEKFR